MLYLSLILIFSGIFFILYTLISRTRKEQVVPVSEFLTGAALRDMPDTHPIPGADRTPAAGTAAGGNPAVHDRDMKPDYVSALKDGKLHVEDEIIFTDYSDINRPKPYPRTLPGKEEKPDMEFEDNDRFVDTIDNEDETQTADDHAPEILRAVLYEDSSNLIDYDMHDSIIDSSLKGYEKIKRLGEGYLEILENGINFKTGSRFFRFDFHMLADIKKGNNFLMLSMKGSDIFRLFLFKEGGPLISKLEQVYKRLKIRTD